MIYNAQKELGEEIKAVLWDPINEKEIFYRESPDLPDDPTPACRILGKVTVDSGSMCGEVCVVLAELASYTANQGHEGILGTIEVSEEELREMIKDGEIDDSFTIEAFMLWLLK